MAAASNYVNNPEIPSVFAWVTAPGGRSINVRYNTVAYHSDGTVAPTPDSVFIRGFGWQSYVPTEVTGDENSVTLKGSGAYGTTTAQFETTVTKDGAVSWKNTPAVGPAVSGSTTIPKQNAHIAFP